jgi:death-on-curing protein
MEGFGSSIAYPTISQIVEVNRRMIDETGGSFTPPANFRNRDSLEYVLDAIKYPVFGKHLFPTLKEKAAALAFEIIKSHVFVDGCKRTGIHIAWEFLGSNEVPIYLDMSIVDLATRLADSRADREELIRWLHGHQDE